MNFIFFSLLIILSSYPLWSTVTCSKVIDPSPICKLLQKACSTGNLQALDKFIVSGADLNCRYGFGQHSLLHLASENGHVDVVEKLIENGFDRNILDGHNWTPIFQASIRGHGIVVQKLISLGAEINCLDIDGWTPLHAASSFNYFLVVEKLIASGADINYREHCYGYTPLHQACRKGHIETVQKLLESGADPNILDKEGNTPLVLASKKKYDNVIKLIKSRTDAVSPRDNRLKPLSAVSVKSHSPVVAGLSESSSELNFFPSMDAHHFIWLLSTFILLLL